MKDSYSGLYNKPAPGLAKPLAGGRTSSPHLISHTHTHTHTKKKEKPRGERRREGRLQTHTRCEQTTKSTHHLRFLSATHWADNAESARSVAGGGYLLSCTVTGGFVADAGPGAGEFLPSAPLHVSVFNRPFFFSSLSSAGCRALLVLICSWGIHGLSDKSQPRVEQGRHCQVFT